MARHYSPRSFFRHAPNVMLKRYFDKQGVLTEHAFFMNADPLLWEMTVTEVAKTSQ